MTKVQKNYNLRILLIKTHHTFFLSPLQRTFRLFKHENSYFLFFGGDNFSLPGSGSADLIESDPIRIRTGFFSLQEDHFALLCCGSSTGQTRIVGSRFDFRSGSVINKFKAHYDVKTKVMVFYYQHYRLPRDAFPIFFRSCQNPLIIFKNE
jgi:hypothetical protein